MTATGRDLHLRSAATGAPAGACSLSSTPAGALLMRPRALSASDVKPGAPWYSIKAAADGAAATIEIYGIIGEAYDWWTGEKVGTSATTFLEDLKAVGDADLDIHINSPGGDVFDGATIYSRLVQHKGKVTVTIDGLAASAASVIAMAGSTIRMPATSMLMIHNPWTIALGEAADMRKTADTLDTIRSSMMAAYTAKNPTMPEADLIAAMDEETWDTAALAKEAGFCDEIVENSNQVAQASKGAAVFRAMLGRFKHAPKALTEAKAEETVEVEAGAKAAAEATGDQDLREQVEVLAATVEALTAQIGGKQQAKPAAKVDPNSPAVKALRKLADAKGRADDFDDAVAAGRSLKELQARFIGTGTGADDEISTAAVVPPPSAETTTQTKLKPGDYAAHRRKQHAAKKEAK